MFMETSGEVMSEFRANSLDNMSAQNRFDNSGGECSPTRYHNQNKHSTLIADGRNSSTSKFSDLSVDEKLTIMFETVNRDCEMMTEVINGQDTYYRTTRAIETNMSSLYERVGMIEEVVDNTLKMLLYKSIDADMRSRQNNLIIWGVTENVQISCSNLVLGFIEHELKLNSRNIVIDRAYRLGSRSGTAYRGKSDPKRPIIAQFQCPETRDLVLHHAHRLKGSPFGIDKDYPKEIAAARKQLHLSNEVRAARLNGHHVEILYPARLVINGNVVLDKFPEWYTLIKANRLCSLHSLQSVHTQLQTDQFNSSGSQSTHQAVFIESTSVDNESVSDTNDYDKITTTQAQTISALSVAASVNKHAHPVSSFPVLDSESRGVSRHNVLHDTHEVSDSSPVLDLHVADNSKRRYQSCHSSSHGPILGIPESSIDKGDDHIDDRLHTIHTRTERESRSDVINRNAVFPERSRHSGLGSCVSAKPETPERRSECTRL